MRASTNERKDINFKMRLSVTQHNQLTDLSRAYGLNYQEFIRRLIANEWDRFYKKMVFPGDEQS